MKLSPGRQATIIAVATIIGAALSWVSVGIVIGLLILR